MTLSNEFHEKSIDEIEEWFLAAVESESLPIEDLLAVLETHGRGGYLTQIEGWAELLQDALVEAGEKDATLRLLEMRCAWRGDSSDFESICRAAAKAVFTSRLEKAFVKNAGFGSGLAPSECLRRLGVLSRLKEGTLCLENTWGFGQIKSVDDFYERVTINFTDKPNHEMSLAYAAEKLDLIDDDHLLARLHRDQAGVTAMFKEDPAEGVKVTLRSYGPTNAVDLKDLLVDRVMSEGDWKGFWDGARKGLKKDPLVHLPTRRNEPIVILDSPETLVSTQLDELGALRDPEGILSKASQMETDGLITGMAPEQLDVVADRLGFAIWGAEGKHPDLAARAILMAVRMGVVDAEGSIGKQGIRIAEALERIVNHKNLASVLSDLPVRDVGGVIQYAGATMPEELSASLIPVLPQLSVSVLGEAIPRLLELNREPDVAECIRSRIADRKATPTLMVWIFNNQPIVEKWIGDDYAELIRQGFDAIAFPAAGDQLRAQHQLRAIFESDGWLPGRMSALSHEQRIVLLNEVQSCRGWDEAGRRSVVASIIKVYPELHKTLTASDSEQKSPKARLTSWRSYRERQAQFKKLMEVEIPENSREIAVARSYGDLRENAEYKYAKEHQRILYRRRDEIEEDLKIVRGADFEGFSTDRVGMGTIVTIKRPSGDCDTYCILGEWDRDEELDIISSESRLAQLLDGAKAGDKVRLPAAVGEEVCEVVAIEGLSDEVLAWLKS